MGIDYELPAPELAIRLLGCELVVRDNLGERGGIITETEAYTAEDPASHSYRGLTNRNAAMFMAPGTIYIYKIYGIHHCLNIVCGQKDGQAVLIRSIFPTCGISIMKAHRNTTIEKNLCNGPAKIMHALALSPELNGRHISRSPLHLKPAIKKTRAFASPRIGITKATETLWRFYINNP